MTDSILSTTHLRKSLVIAQKIGGGMKHLTPAVLFALLAASLPLFAQHVEFGGFGAYSQHSLTGFADHLFGLGGRADFNAVKMLQLELELGYDFAHPSVQLQQTTGVATLTDNRLRVLHANAGLKLQTPDGSFFLFLKGGANAYGQRSNVQTISGIPPFSVITLTGPERTFTKGVLYPGGGIGFHAGILGIRFDAGDEIVWNNGANHNLRITFGPTVRF